MALKRSLVILVALLIVAGVAYAAWTRFSPSGSGRLDIQTTAFARANVTRVISTSGTVKARVQVDVSTQLSGQIAERPVDYNSIVKQGDLLARLDPAPFQSKIDQLNASIAVATASLATANAGLQKASISLAKAQSDLDTNKTLAAKGAVTTAAVQTADNTYQLAQADYASAQAAVENAKANLQERQAELASAEIDLDHTYIRAPINGIVIDRSIEVGQTVAASSTAPKLFTIAQDLSTIDIAGQVDESDVAQIAVGDPVTFRVDAFPGASFAGAVSQVRLAPTTSQGVVTYTIVVGANNPGGRLIPGMTANLDVVTGDRHGVLAVPNEALRYTPSGAALALVRKGGEAGAPVASPGASTLDAGDVVAGLQRALGLDDATVARIRAAFADADANGLGSQPPARPAGGAASASGGGQARNARGGSGPGTNGAAGQARSATSAPTGPAGDPSSNPPAVAELAVSGPGTGGGLTPVSAAAPPAPTQRAKADQILQAILSPDQYARYQAIAADLQSAPPTGVLWVREADGTLSKHVVQLGLASLNTTEIAASDIAEGALIVLRVRDARR
jgi:HlyD family secretion protein